MNLPLKSKFITILVLVVLVFPFIANATVDIVFPMAFWGEISINGSPASTGTILSAYYGDTLAGQVILIEDGIYGYNESTKQKLVVGEGSEEIIFKFKTDTFNGGVETTGLNIIKYDGFESGKTINKNLSFTLVVPTPTPTPVPAPSGGGGGGGGGSFITPVSPTPTPEPIVAGASVSTPNIKPADFNLTEGDTISALNSNDPDVYIVNEWGYKRLFLNPVIFGFYGHLGGFSNVKHISAETRDAFVTSGLFRNCEINDKKVYAVDVTGEDAGYLHWIDMSGDQAVDEDPEFFKKVFCINNNEFNWYPKSSIDYTSLSQVPVYTRN